MLIFERKNTVGWASALFLFVETGWRTGKRTAHRNSLPPPASAALTLGLAVVWVKKEEGSEKD